MRNQVDNSSKNKNNEEVVLSNGIISSMSIGRVFKDFVETRLFRKNQ